MPNNINDKIFSLLSEEEFKDPDTGLLFFPVYIYTYNPEKEFQIREEIKELDRILQRPLKNLNCLVLNIYNEFIDYLKHNIFMGSSLLEQIFELEEINEENALDFIAEKAQEKNDNDAVEKGFINHIGEKLKAYFDEKSPDRVYLLLYGFGSIFPYLRLSEFLKKTEEYVRNYKLIAFYPGELKNDHYSLFGIFGDENVYRANHLNQLISQ